ncbi:MAG: hypothetical protein SFU25_04620 [Candidatus Caenarcaniphilales bacterium]|nr:hypothetical protein [Candidatus Caenarcaniphilales bacterium]
MIKIAIIICQLLLAINTISVLAEEKLLISKNQRFEKYVEPGNECCPDPTSCVCLPGTVTYLNNNEALFRQIQITSSKSLKRIHIPDPSKSSLKKIDFVNAFHKLDNFLKGKTQLSLGELIDWSIVFNEGMTVDSIYAGRIDGIVSKDFDQTQAIYTLDGQQEGFSSGILIKVLAKRNGNFIQMVQASNSANTIFLSCNHVNKCLIKKLKTNKDFQKAAQKEAQELIDYFDMYSKPEWFSNLN